MRTGITQPAGTLGLRVISRNAPSRTVRLRDYAPDFLPRRGLPDIVNEYRTRNLPNIWRGARRIAAANAFGVPTLFGSLHLTLWKNNDFPVDLGCVSLRVVTDAGVAYIVDAFQNSTELENMKYHGYGTGGTAEAAAQTALVTELTTEYATNSTRPTGTTTENAANIYETVATLSPDSGGTLAITEHGVFSATSAGTMLDRSLFSAVNLVAGSDSLQSTYRLTFTSGG